MTTVISYKPASTPTATTAWCLFAASPMGIQLLPQADSFIYNFITKLNFKAGLLTATCTITVLSATYPVVKHQFLISTCRTCLYFIWTFIFRCYFPICRSCFHFPNVGWLCESSLPFYYPQRSQWLVSLLAQLSTTQVGQLVGGMKFWDCKVSWGTVIYLH